MSAPLDLLIADGIIDEVLGRLKSGKEADISLVRRGDDVIAAKVYKDRATRSFKNNTGYKEGRKVRNTRTQRAMDSGGSFGRDAAEQAWKSAEADVMYKLVDSGVRIPTPLMFYEGVLLMDLVRGEDGHPAPRMIDVAIEREAAVGIYADLVAQIISMLCCDVIHGDLSPYNILAAAEGPTIIDFPQVISAVHNSRAEFYFLRDFDNVVRFIAGFDPSLLVHTADGRAIWRAYVSRDLTPEFVPPPPPPPRPTRGPDRRSRPDDRGRPPQRFDRGGGSGRSPQGQGGGRPPQSAGGSQRWQGPQNQGGGRPPQSQGGGRPPQSQGGGRPPQNPGGAQRWQGPQNQGGGSPQNQGGGPPQNQGGGRPPQNQGGYQSGSPNPGGSRRPDHRWQGSPNPGAGHPPSSSPGGGHGPDPRGPRPPQREGGPSPSQYQREPGTQREPGNQRGPGPDPRGRGPGPDQRGPRGDQQSQRPRREWSGRQPTSAEPPRPPPTSQPHLGLRTVRTPPPSAQRWSESRPTSSAPPPPRGGGGRRRPKRRS